MDELSLNTTDRIGDLGQLVDRLTRDREILAVPKLTRILAVLMDERHIASADVTGDQREAVRHLFEHESNARRDLLDLRRFWDEAVGLLMQNEERLSDLRTELKQKSATVAWQSQQVERLESELAYAAEHAELAEQQLAEMANQLQKTDMQAKKFALEKLGLSLRGQLDARRASHPQRTEQLHRDAAGAARAPSDEPTRPEIAPIAAMTEPGSWKRLRESSLNGRGGICSVTAGGPGVVAVGYDDRSGTAAVWTSPDGHSWSRVEGSAEAFTGSRQVMHGVVGVSSGLIAVGADLGRRLPAAWTSVDGLAWNRATIEEFNEAGNRGRQMRSVVAGGPGFVAVGYDETCRAAAVWTSKTGECWERIEHDEAVFGGDGQQMMSCVIRGGPGLVAVGRQRATSQSGLIWVSEEGQTWTRLDGDRHTPTSRDFRRAMRKREVRSVTSFGSALVAVGRHLGGAAVWISEDGLKWWRVEDQESLLQPGGMSSVTVAGTALVAVGFRSGRPAVWTSQDGRGWSHIDYDETVFDEGVMSSVAASGQVVVAAGQRQGRPGLWSFQ